MASRFFFSSSFFFFTRAERGAGAADRALSKSQKMAAKVKQKKTRRAALEMGEIELFRVAVIQDRQGRTRVWYLVASMYPSGRKGSRAANPAARRRHGRPAKCSL